MRGMSIATKAGGELRYRHRVLHSHAYWWRNGRGRRLRIRIELWQRRGGERLYTFCSKSLCSEIWTL